MVSSLSLSLSLSLSQLGVATHTHTHTHTYTSSLLWMKSAGSGMFFSAASKKQRDPRVARSSLHIALCSVFAAAAAAAACLLNGGCKLHTRIMFWEELLF